MRIATWDRVPHFASAHVVQTAREQLLLACDRGDFAVNAYCFMPDHVHVLVAGRGRDANLPRTLASWKQRTGYHWNRGRYRAARPATRQQTFSATSEPGLVCDRLWQPGYFERVLRENEDDETVARYILGNPVRAGLVQRVSEYAFSWCRWEIE